MPKQYVSPAGHPPAAVYTHLVKADRLLFISGQVGFREQRRLVEGGIAAQTRQALDNIGQLLAAGGASWTDVVKLNIYLVEMAHLPLVREVRAEYYAAVGVQAPATTTVGVTGLAAEGALIEIEAVAVLD
jgi:reactive intermediate/imine deaminase